MFKSVTICLMLFVSIQSSCNFLNSSNLSKGGVEYSEICKIPKSDENKRLALFNSYPIEKQIDIFLYAMRQRDYVFEVYLTKNGEAKLPQLAEEIKVQKDLRNKAELISIISNIDRICEIEKNINCVANDSKIMEILKKSESPPNQNDPEFERSWEKNYSWTLFELQRKSQDKKNKPEIQNAPNPYSNSNTK